MRRRRSVTTNIEITLFDLMQEAAVSRDLSNSAWLREVIMEYFTIHEFLTEDVMRKLLSDGD